MTMISDSAMLSELAAEFPGYEFSTQRTWEGVSLIAIRQKGQARSGLYVVIIPRLRRDAPDPAQQHGAQQHGAQQHGARQHGPRQHGPRQHGARGREPRTVAA